MYFGEILVLLFLQFLEKEGIRLVSVVAIHEGFLKIHDILTRGFFESEDLNMTEIGVLYSLDKLDLLFEVLLIFN
jgi:DUF1009 family protein